MDIIISYNTYRKHAKKYNIKDKTNNGKPITYNKLKRRVDQFESKKHQPSKKQLLHNTIRQYLGDEIDYNVLNEAMYHYIGN